MNLPLGLWAIIGWFFITCTCNNSPSIPTLNSLISPAPTAYVSLLQQLFLLHRNGDFTSKWKICSIQLPKLDENFINLFIPSLWNEFNFFRLHLRKSLVQLNIRKLWTAPISWYKDRGMGLSHTFSSSGQNFFKFKLYLPTNQHFWLDLVQKIDMTPEIKEMKVEWKRAK